jgi:hypothetical protein
VSDTLLPLKIPPGIYRNGTRYQARDRWYDSNLVRFVDGDIQPIGGWRYLQTAAGSDLALINGVPRAAIAWRGETGSPYIAIGTTEKLYVIVGGVLYDITPAGFTPGREDSGYNADPGAYGAGAFGAGAYGVGASTSAIAEADTWQLDTFGDWLVAVCTSDRKLYVWDGDTSHLASTPAGAPTSCAAVVVTPERFLVALGTDGNIRQVAWPSQETTTDWAPLPTNSAGDFPITTPGQLLAGRRTRNETLLWTDTDLHVMTYVGGLFVYRFAEAGQKCGAISSRAMSVIDTKAMWMGNNNFYVYDGYVQPLACEVRDYVFGDFNAVQAAKVWSITVAQYGELWWFYCSAGSSEIDRYVVFNYRENHWTIGKLSRTAGCDADAVAQPVMISARGDVFEHEILQSRPAVVPGEPGIDLLTENGATLLTEDGAALTTEQTAPYLESGPLQLGDGDRLLSILRLVPDEKTLGDVTATIFTSLFPTGEEQVSGPHSLANPTSLRAKGRQARIRLEEARATNWRVGVMRFGVQPSSRR